MAALPLPDRSRLPFVLATALIAGGLGDPLIETIGDTGIWGPGYHDTNHLGVLPALICGLVLILEAGLLRCLQALRHETRDARGDRAWLIAVARRFSSRAPLRDVAYVFALQLGVVFAIETAEQLMTGGKVHGGTAWLGGPMAFSLTMYALVALVVTIATAWLTRGIATTLASLVRIAFAFIALAALRDADAPLHERRDGAPFSRPHSPRARQVGERAPPRLLASA